LTQAVYHDFNPKKETKEKASSLSEKSKILSCWGRGLHLAAVAASQPVGMLSRPGHAPLAILQPLLMLSDVGRREA